MPSGISWPEIAPRRSTAIATASRTSCADSRMNCGSWKPPGQTARMSPEPSRRREIGSASWRISGDGTPQRSGSSMRSPSPECLSWGEHYMTLASGPILACGVDFGMTTSSLGVATTADGVRLIEDPEVPAGVRHDIPTALCFGSDNKIYIGTDAVRTAGSSPEGYVDNFKRNVGEPQPIYLRGRPFAVEEMIGFILRFLRDQGNMLGAAQAVRTALTAPSVWTDAKKKVLQSAAEAAGFDMGTLSLEEEPVAAYEYVRTLGPVEENRPVLVYDLGGGTFDCALLRPAPSGGAQTLLRDGLPRLGGVDFDYAVKDELASRYPQVREFLNAGLNRQAELGLMASCEAIKKRLSRS